MPEPILPTRHRARRRRRLGAAAPAQEASRARPGDEPGMAVRGAGRRGDLRQPLRRLPPAGREGAEGAGAYPALAGNEELASAEDVLRIVLGGRGACRRSAG